MENPTCNDNVSDKIPAKIFIALPCYWNVDPMFTQCLMRVIHGLKVPVVIRWCIGDSLVGRARNRLTREFLETDCTHLLWIDTDLVFSLDHIERIVSHDQPIVGGLYCKKQEGDPQLVLNRFDEIEPLVGDALQSVKYIGTGFMCIKREVFDKMAAMWPEDSYKADETDLPEHDYWRVGVYQFKDGSKRYLSEDWWFCQRALELGYKIYADMKVLLGHVGHATFPLRTQEAALFGKEEGIVSPIKKQENIDRFWKFTDKTDTCWNWNKALDRDGYGHICVGKLPSGSNDLRKAHRFSWELHYGPIPEGLVVMHQCDNPKCVNPSHLSVGTHGDNVKDKIKKGRSFKKITDEGVKELRWLASQGVKPKELAARYGVSRNTTKAIIKRHYRDGRPNVAEATPEEQNTFSLRYGLPKGETSEGEVKISFSEETLTETK